MEIPFERGGFFFAKSINYANRLGTTLAATVARSVPTYGEP